MNKEFCEKQEERDKARDAENAKKNAALVAEIEELKGKLKAEQTKRRKTKSAGSKMATPLGSDDENF